MIRRIFNDARNPTFLIFVTVFAWWAVFFYADHFSQIVRDVVIGVASLTVFLVGGKLRRNRDQPKARAAGTILFLLAVVLLIALPSLPEAVADLLITLLFAVLAFTYRDFLHRNVRKPLATAVGGCLVYYLDDFGFPFGKPIGWCLFAVAGFILLLQLFIGNSNEAKAAGS